MHGEDKKYTNNLFAMPVLLGRLKYIWEDNIQLNLKDDDCNDGSG
jgi:hypothetical protein